MAKATPNEDLATDKRNIESVFLNTYKLLKMHDGYEGDTLQFDLNKHTLKSFWESHRILNSQNTEETIIRITMEGVAIYE